MSARRVALVLALVLVTVVGCTPAATPGPSPAGLPADTSAFRGVNWADPRDNFAADAVVPSGLDVADDYATTYAKSASTVRAFESVIRASTVRLPVNPASVGTAWWASYQGAIDASTDAGFTVILSYWESERTGDGRIDDRAAWDAMWATVVARYRDNPRVFFEPMNEPHGYRLADWVQISAAWLARHPEVPRSRVIVSGTGYNDDVTGVGAAPELDGTLLSFHLYGYYADLTSEAAWKAGIPTRIGPYGSRTVVDEAGGPMTTGLNYGNHEGNRWTSFFGALTEVTREQKIGVVYWPGLRTGDEYALTVRDGDTLRVTNASGLAQLQWGWGLTDTEPSSDDPPSPTPTR